MKKPLSIQHPLVSAEVVEWDGLVFLASTEKNILVLKLISFKRKIWFVYNNEPKNQVVKKSIYK